MGYYRHQNEQNFSKNLLVGTVVVNDVTSTRQNLITRVFLQCFRARYYQLIIAMTCDKTNHYI